MFGSSKHTWILLVWRRSRNASVTKLSITTNAPRCYVPKRFLHFVYVGHNNMLHVFHYGLFHRPVPWGMGDVPSWWKCQSRMTPWGLSFVTSLDRKQIAHQRSTECTCDLAFIINSNHLNTLCTCSTIGHIEEGTILIPVSSQFPPPQLFSPVSCNALLSHPSPPPPQLFSPASCNGKAGEDDLNLFQNV